MGQYWEWLCLGKKERLGTHELSYGIKWWEQFSASGMYSGIMMLKTDVSSLGHGGGDLQVDEVPAPLQPLVKAVLGRWTGDIIELAGDYGLGLGLSFHANTYYLRAVELKQSLPSPRK